MVPLFALANAGITVTGAFLAHAYAWPVTLGILLGYVVGNRPGSSARPSRRPGPDPDGQRLDRQPAGTRA